MKNWRDSASLILAARHEQNYNRTVSPTVCNYNLLCLKRHHKMDFMPGTYVFPGGAVDPADSSLKWYELFSSCGFNNNSLASLVSKTMVRPQIFRSRQNELPREISLRITAIRETFEECGVLMCRKKNDHAFSTWGQHMSIPKDELQIWRNKVHNDATQFFILCEEYKCYPDLWALHEWNNWLTPIREGKRFDTIFYLACMSIMPYAEYEAMEMEDLKWETPENLLSSSLDLVLPPPQLYEVTKLTEFKNIDNLLDFAVERSKAGVQLYYPVVVEVKDGVVVVLPGDSLYPKKVNLIEKQTIDRSDMTINELRETTPIKNRMEFFDGKMKVIQVDNVQTTNNHIEFISEKTGEPQIKNKL